MAFDLFGRKAKAELKQMQEMVGRMVGQRLNTFTVHPTYEKQENSLRFCETDDVYSIVNLISSTAALIPVYPYIKDSQGNETDAPENDPLKLLVEKPFEGMSSFESYYVLCATLLMQGEYILWKENPELGPNKGKVVRLHYMPPQDMNHKVSNTFPRRIVSWQYAPDGHVVFDDIPAEQVIHVKYFNPQRGFLGNELRGLSPLTVLTKRLTRVDSNMDATVAQLQNGGVPGIVYEKGMDANIQEVVSKRRDNFFKYLSNSANKGAPYFSAGDMSYIQLGLKLADLEAADLAKIDFKKLCNVFGVSDRLFNNDATGSEVSDKGARQGLYTNVIMPLLKRVTDGFEMGLAIHFPQNKYCIEADFSEVPELQVNYTDLVGWLEKAWWISPNEKREVMLFEKVNDPIFDSFVIPSGVQTLDDLKMIDQPIDPNGDYGQTGQSNP